MDTSFTGYDGSGHTYYAQSLDELVNNIAFYYYSMLEVDEEDNYIPPRDLIYIIEHKGDDDSLVSKTVLKTINLNIDTTFTQLRAGFLEKIQDVIWDRELDTSNLIS